MAITSRNFLAAALSGKSSGQSDSRRFDPRNLVIDQLLKGSLGQQKIQHPAQGFAQLANTALVASLMKDVRSEQEERDAKVSERITAALEEARATPEVITPIAAEFADVTPGTGLAPGGGFETITPGRPGSRRRAFESLTDSGIPELETLGLEGLLAKPEFVEVYDPETNVYRRILTDEALGTISKPGPKPAKTLERIREEAEAGRPSLDRIAAEAKAKREPIENAIRRASRIAEAQREPIAQAAERAREIVEAKRGSIEDAARRAKEIAKAQRISIEEAAQREEVLAIARRESIEDAAARAGAVTSAQREPIENAAVRAAVLAAVKRESIGDAAARAGAVTKAQEGAKAKFGEPKRTIRTGLGGAVIDIDSGEVLTPGSLNVIEQETGKQLTIPIRTAKEMEDVLDRLASGEIVEGRIRRTREVTDIPPAIRILFPDLPADMTPEQARLKGINIDLLDKTLEGLLESKGDVEQLDRVFTELQGIIAKTPAALGTAGFIARTGNSILAQLPLISELVGVEFEPELLVTENYESTFKEIGVESQRLKSATLGAAYALALAQRRRGGRMAQQDVERALVQISGQDPKATIKVLQDLKERTAEGFRTRAASLLGRQLPRIEVTSSPVISRQGAMPRLSTQEEVDKLSPGTSFFWVPTKEIGIKERKNE